MRRVVIRLSIALVTFALGIAATLFWIEYKRPVAQEPPTPPCVQPPNYESVSVPCSGVDLSSLGELPDFSYCELLDNADRYSDVVIRLHANFNGFIHGLFLYDKQCSVKNNNIAVKFLASTEQESRQTLSQAAGSDFLFFIPLEVVVTGKFEKVAPSGGSDSSWGTSPLHFEIISVEKASKVR